ncbi:MAG: TIGR02147 family protein [Myxococcota bacterium]
MDLDIYTFTDYRKFLRAWLSQRPERSYQLLARQVGCSKSLIAQIINQKRDLTAHRIPDFIKGLQMAPEEGAYFRALVDLCDSPHLSVRRQALGQVTSTQHFRDSNRTGLAIHKLYSKWYIAVVAELAQCVGFVAEPEWIAQHTRPSISIPEAREALAVLQELGLFQVGEDGTLHADPGTWTIGHNIYEQISALALFDLHAQNMALATDTLNHTRGDDRQFESITFAIHRDQFSTFRDMVRRFQEQVIHLASGNAEEKEQVYQLSIQLFPVSETTR